MKKTILLSIFLALFLVSCSTKETSQTFAEAHDAFQTKLLEENRDNDKIPAPPEGLFDLIQYPSKVGDLSAYVSSDPGDGQKHPMIIWVVGGWGNGIDDFPWSYPYWDNDQTGSAFWKAGVLTMYPSFRGGSGNPGYYETLFGEVDDIVSAYDYAASLPYVDPDRIYLGGHSTGGTRALLASEYTDKFRAVFCFGAVGEIKYHNNDQFTFDTSIEEESVMRSPIYWLQDVKSPTFIIEGIEGNSIHVNNIKEKSNNEQISCYIIDGADHFSVLAPITKLVAQKILADTEDKPNISFTQEELMEAMEQEPSEPLPVMVEYKNETLGLRFSHPYTWEVQDTSDSDGLQLSVYSRYDEDNVWDMSTLYVDAYTTDMSDYMDGFRQYLQLEGYTIQDTNINGLTAFEADGVTENSNGSRFTNKLLLIQQNEGYVTFDFYIHEDYGNSADLLFQTMIDSISQI